MGNTLTILVEASLHNGGGHPYLTGFLLVVYFLQLPCIQWRLVFHHGDYAILLNLNPAEYVRFKEISVGYTPVSVHNDRQQATNPKSHYITLRFCTGSPLMVFSDRHVAVIKKICDCVDGGGKTFSFYTLKEISIESCLKP